MNGRLYEAALPRDVDRGPDVESLIGQGKKAYEPPKVAKWMEDKSAALRWLLPASGQQIFPDSPRAGVMIVGIALVYRIKCPLERFTLD